MAVPVRFDDLTPGEADSFELTGGTGELIAHSLDEVVPVLEAVEAATARGRWAAGYVAYDAAPAFDPALRVRGRALGDPFAGMPLAWFGLFSEFREAEPLQPRRARPAGYGLSPWTPSVTGAEFAAADADVRDAILRGDTYQLSHTFRLRASFSGDPAQLYRDLVVSQNGGYGALLDLGRFQVLSTSPEGFFRLDNGDIVLRPIKGSVRRGRWTAEDMGQAEVLAAAAAGRAENLMIVDVLRSDLGHIAELGSTSVDELYGLERHPRKWRLASQVRARLRAGVGLADVFAALFPAASLTGAPRPSTMALIADLESTARGVYCGAIGWVAPRSHPRGSRFGLAIRTVVVDCEQGLAEYGAGGTVTWDSTAVDYDEALRDARALLSGEEDFSLYETMRWEDGEYHRLEEHLRRLADSADYFGFAYSEHEVRGALTKYAATLYMTPDAARVRLDLSRSGSVEVSTEITGLLPFVDSPEDAGFATHPIHLTVADGPVDAEEVWLFHQTTRRAPHLAARALAPSVDDTILFNQRGAVTEATIANIAVRFGDVWLTPLLEDGCLPGVYRGIMLEQGRLQEAPIPLADLSSADDVAVINSVYGWRRAVVLPRTDFAGRIG